MPASLPVLPESMETLLHNAPNKLRQYITKMYQFSTAAVEELHELSTLCSTITNLLNCIQQKDGVIKYQKIQAKETQQELFKALT
ncbi:hypothetical protein P175DRAFT_0502579 [Aspergillus ochraceoroseus IBT 24754]|uniref:Uncharacterized protein n=1 Tax=Aspergillus ochraceoroseus IBT 24754 TaxID=1392256 RepID=A0A2T5LRZ7_9EURO|nr:uncharacterized protein P175DRAFT_0502579 [Aspergillus ochraceoroseus IBT 24754]PTU19058.1 hypothetical protein P175DRAFT_0502579 [Aspergillus ochraceoroseus IBT 24754]